jgi:hypothetical protein
MHWTRKAWVVWLPAFGLAVALTGCGADRPQTIPVTGRVTLDGRPVEGAVVGFLPKGGGRPATGTTDASGAFTLTTFDEGDGALPGVHLVTVTNRSSKGKDGAPGGGDSEGAERGMTLTGPMGGAGQKQPNAEWLVPEKYSLPRESGLTCTVATGMAPPTFELTSGD